MKDGDMEPQSRSAPALISMKKYNAGYGQIINRDRLEYDRRTTYPNYPRKGYYNSYVPTEMKYLRLYWDESDSASTEFHLRYNVSRPGFWISSGPEVGMSLNPKFSHFAGTIQVLKAVGTHLVPTFLPPNTREATLYLKLEPVEIHGVHGLLHRKGLSTNAVKKVCNNKGNRISEIELYLLLIPALIKFVI
ncbi:hypothetical protein NQ317_015054 [Molorchus minor]|uniref:Uncharacterized protein n=1 Tax=Molorchus minor TaxID=1323400 RepID=A0ABQ9K4I4_9CUCU|nr:hypothetical protein NQ317_015054 [Molorchus minor]